MQHRTLVAAIFVSFYLLFPVVASAQSSIVGLVKDESGGVLPGVTVEVASPVLIEKVRAGVSDDQGRYRIENLRPGSYRITFTLSGFGTLVRDGVELPSNFTATINAELKVGTLQESVTVTGQTPLVDVQQASRTQVLSRDVLDTLPTSRNIMSVGALVPGIRAGVPDVGGSRSMEQPSARGHGLNSTNMTQMFDGQMIQSQEGSEGSSMTYIDDALQSEVTIITAAIPADTANGGIRYNSIPREGGNIVSGAVFVGGSNGLWQSKNVDDALRKRGIASANGTTHVENFNASMGGPIKKERLWFFTAARHISEDETVANVPKEIVLPDGTIIRSILDQFVRTASVRLTWQASEKNKLSGWFTRIWKRKGKDFAFGADPRTSAQRDARKAHYGAGQVRWGNTWSNKILLDGGYSTSYQHYSGSTQPGTLVTAFSPEWYANAQKTDTALNTNFYPDGCPFVTGCTSWMGGNLSLIQATRRVIAASGAYVTGTHNFKVGFQDSFGPYNNYFDRNGGLNLNYSNGKPSTVTVYNTPAIQKAYVNYDLGIFVQDGWTIRRLTLNPGVRANWFNSMMKAVALPAGRFAPARYFPDQPDLPNWGPDWAPRFSAAYDLFGNGKTALKTSASKYYSPRTNGFATRYANSGQTTESRNWSDCDLAPGTSTCSVKVLSTNGDNIAQDNEIGPSSSANFGSRSDRNPAPDLKRFSNWEYTAAVQHQLMPRVSMSASYFRRTYRDLEVLDRGQITNADYTSFGLPMPNFANDPTLSGVLDPSELLTIYNLSTAKRSVFSASQVDFNSTGAFGGVGPNQSTYNGFETSFSARLTGFTVFGGWTMEKNVSNFCDYNDDPNGVTTAELYRGVNVANGGRFCDQGQFSIPFNHEFKLAGNYPLPYGVEFGAVMQSYPGLPRTITWQPGANLFPGAARTNAETIILNTPGSLFQPRYNQLDVNFKKNFRSGSKRYSLQVDLFNALNGNAIWTTNDAIGSSLGQVQSILPGRLPRVAFQMQW